MLPVFVISLSEAHSRRSAIRGRLNALGIPFQFYDAVDARRSSGPTFFGFKIDPRSQLSPTQIACALSHLCLIRHIAENTSDMALILEDDAALSPEIPDILEAAARHTFDMLKLEGVARMNRPYLDRGAIDHTALRVFSYVSLGTAAYILRRNAAQRLLAFASTIDDPIDEIFSKSELDIVEAYPYPVRQDQSPTQQDRMPERPTWSRRLRNSYLRRVRIVRMYGAGAYLAMEKQKFLAFFD